MLLIVKKKISFPFIEGGYFKIRVGVTNNIPLTF